MNPHDIDTEAIIERVRARHERRYRFYFHTIVFVFGFFPVMSLQSSFLFFVWIGAWASHLLWLNYQSSLEEAIVHEIETERQRVIKAKRGLTDADYSDDRLWDDYDEQVYRRYEDG